MAPSLPKDLAIGSLKASTENLGDYIQILACLSLLDKIQLKPSVYLDRDTELATAPALESWPGRILLPLNGWFKQTVGGDPQWPPHRKIIPAFIGFHMRPFQCPALLEPRSIAYMKAHEPIGCRDTFTMNALRDRGVSAYLSNCLSLTFPARPPDEPGDTVVVASRDREILALLPPQYRDDHVYVNHYSVRDGFEAYLAEATRLLDFYRKRARLVITTFLHCALPCIAMGIPVIAFFPNPKNDFQKTSDDERFSGLTAITRVHRLDDASSIDWNPKPIDLDDLKNTIRQDFQQRITRSLTKANSDRMDAGA